MYASYLQRRYLGRIKINQLINTSTTMPRVFFITGTSTGFGNHLVQEVLDKGDIAVATARKPETLKFNGTNDTAGLTYPSSRLKNPY
jgi:hypothetical protein